MSDDTLLTPRALRIALVIGTLVLLAAGTTLAKGPGDTVCLHTGLTGGCL